MLRICYIASANSIHTQRWINYFTQRDHEIYLISRRFPEGFEKFDSKVHTHPLVKLIPLPQTSKISMLLTSIAWILQVRKLLRQIKPDILDAHFIGVPGYLGAVSGFHPLSLTALGSDILIMPKKSQVYKFLTKRALKTADIVVCNSETMKRELLNLGANPQKIRIIYNGVDTNKFSPSSRKLGLTGPLKIISIRMFKPVYNMEMLIRAIPLVLEQTPETQFIIAGEGPQRKYLLSLIASLRISNNVEFVGLISHNKLPEYLASSDIYVSTSLSDSTSLSLQEAMACELPPVITDLPGNREWITDGENGFIIPQGDIKTLANKLVYLVKNEDLRRKFGKLGREIIKEKAEYEVEMAKMEQLYREVGTK